MNYPDSKELLRKTGRLSIEAIETATPPQTEIMRMLFQLINETSRQNVVLSQILEQSKKTNGRVDALENWRDDGDAQNALQAARQAGAAEAYQHIRKYPRIVLSLIKWIGIGTIFTGLSWLAKWAKWLPVVALAALLTGCGDVEQIHPLDIAPIAVPLKTAHEQIKKAEKQVESINRTGSKPGDKSLADVQLTLHAAESRAVEAESALLAFQPKYDEQVKQANAAMKERDYWKEKAQSLAKWKWAVIAFFGAIFLGVLSYLVLKFGKLALL